LESPATENLSHSQRRWREIFKTVRAAEWWEFKLAPVLAIIYATAFLLKLSIISLWPLLLLVLVALAACAAYVSVINDVADFDDDMASAKANRLVGKSSALIAMVLALCIIPGIAVAFYLRREPLLISLYLASWTAFTLYSLSPIRLKNRGGWGVMADASGAHLFPTLLAIALVYRWSLKPFDAVWFASAGVWSLSFGIRGIIWHQLNDLRYDEKINLRTFARTHSIAWLQRLGNFIVFPTELAALVVMLWRTRCVIAVTLLGFYALLNFLRKRIWGSNFCVVVPKPKFHHIVMHEYYEVFFPLAFILASSSRYTMDAIIIIVHALVFPKRARGTIIEIALIVRGLWRIGKSKRVPTPEPKVAHNLQDGHQ
jgi:4-hydroxybenzoate polyprenyltransferase